MKFYTVILFSFLLVSLSLCSQTMTPLSEVQKKEVEHGIRQMNASTKSISSNFQQEKNMSFLSEKVKSNGKFFYLKEARIRWEYEAPSKYTAIITDGKIHIDDGTRKNTVDTRSNKGFKELNDMMLQCINGTISSNSSYAVSYFNAGENFIVRLQPKSKNLKEFVVNIDLYIDKSNYSVVAIRMLESAEGDYTHIRFIDRKFNQPLESKLFIIH